MRVGGHIEVLLLLIYIYITLKSYSGAVPLNKWVEFAKPARSRSFCCSFSSKSLPLFSMPSKTRLSHFLLGHPVGLFIYFFYSRTFLNFLIMYIISIWPNYFSFFSVLALFTNVQLHIFF
jgi:hypothetical protein